MATVNRKDTENAGAMSLCLTTRKIWDEKEPVRYMYREEPDNNLDSGWRLLAGTETNRYMNDPDNSIRVRTESVVALDSAITPYLDAPFNTEFERLEGKDEFKQINSGLFNEENKD